MRKKLIVLTTILGLIAFSGVAAAQEQEPEDTQETGDTTFNYGYDEDNGVFIWGSSASDGDFECGLENGSLDVVYGDSSDGGLLVQDLLHLGETVEFDPAEEGGDSVEYDPEGEDCQLAAGEVAGPEGQVNHGMFLKTFNAMFDGKARGCMVRHIAQSDLGKGDQQVNVSDVEEPEETEETEGTEEPEEVTGSVNFETVMTDCLHGPGDDAEIEGEDNSKGRPGWVTRMLNEKGGDDDDGEVESQDEDDDSGRRGPPDHARGKGPKG